MNWKNAVNWLYTLCLGGVTGFASFSVGKLPKPAGYIVALLVGSIGGYLIDFIRNRFDLKPNILAETVTFILGIVAGVIIAITTKI